MIRRPTRSTRTDTLLPYTTLFRSQRMLAADNPYMQECFDRMAATHILPRSVVETTARHAVAYLDKRILMAEVEQNFPDPRALDGWVPKQDFTGRKSFVRAFAPRLITIGSAHV